MQKLMIFFLGIAIIAFAGCTQSKMITMKSEPAGAEVTVNGHYIGKAPVSYLFIDRPLTAEDYIVTAKLEGYYDDTRVFIDKTSGGINRYVPDDILFKLNPRRSGSPADSTKAEPQSIDVLIKGYAAGSKSRQQDYREALLNAKLQAIERAGADISSYTKVENFSVKQDLIETRARAALEPGFQIMDMGYQPDGSYLVILSGKVTPLK